jgi:hypothetical protein
VGGEVLSYFIVQIEVIEIQIGLEFRKYLKIKKTFLSFIWPWAEFGPAGLAEPIAAQRRSSPTPHRVITETEMPPAKISMKSNGLMNPSQI